MKGGRGACVPPQGRGVLGLSCCPRPAPSPPTPESESASSGYTLLFSPGTHAQQRAAGGPAGGAAWGQEGAYR